MAAPNPRPSTTQVIRAKAYFGDVPDNAKDEAFRACAVILAEARRQTPVTAQNSVDDCIDVIASYFPPAGQPAAPPAEVRATIAEVLLVYTPREARRAANSLLIPAEGTAAGVIQVNTAEAVERAEKAIVVGGVKMPRKSETPFCCFYPHSYLPLLNDHVDAAPAVGSQPAYIAWERAIDAILGPNIPEHHQFKLKRMKKIAESWFQVLGKMKTPGEPLTATAISEAMARMWFANIENILELYLITTELQTTAMVATRTFATAVDAKWHSGDMLDYYTAMTAAKNDTTISLPYQMRPVASTLSSWKALGSYASPLYRPDNDTPSVERISLRQC